MIRKVNRRVNERVRAQADRGEEWRRPGAGWNAYGDCEDFAIEKRAQLIEAGIAPEDMFFAVGYRRGLGLHAVLVVRSAEGDLVLDSRTPYVNFWADTPYVWVLRQVPADPTRWTSAQPDDEKPSA